MRRSPAHVLGLIGLALILEPLGHQIAYVFRLGLLQAAQAQAVGAHAYFPAVAGTSAGLLGFLGLGSALAVVAVRLAFGRPAARVGGVLGTFAMLALAQGGLFFVQESLEAASRQAAPDLMAIAISTLVGQLPLAAAAAWLTTWLRGYAALAPAAIRVLLTVRLGRPAQAIVHWATQPMVARALLASGVNPRRGPPASSLT